MTARIINRFRSKNDTIHLLDRFEAVRDVRGPDDHVIIMCAGSVVGVTIDSRSDHRLNDCKALIRPPSKLRASSGIDQSQSMEWAQLGGSTCSRLPIGAPAETTAHVLVGVPDRGANLRATDSSGLGHQPCSVP